MTCHLRLSSISISRPRTRTFAAHKIDDLVEGFGRTVDWKPMLLGAAHEADECGRPLAHSIR